MSVDAKTIKEVFMAALDKGVAAERAAYLHEACGGDAALRQGVEALLRSHDRPDALLDQPAAQHVAAEMDAAPLDFLEPSAKPGAVGRLGHYDVLEAVGQGGMGVVMRAFDGKLHRVVAIKALMPILASNGAARRRFVREARAAAAVTHDNVIDIHAVEDDGPVPYLVMQFIDGCTLQEKVDRTGPLPLKEILRIGLQIAEGLAAAHRHGLIHRDIKPANILLENGIERVKITDFGLARTVDDASLTTSGSIAGTPAYMSPEQANGERLDHRSDLFSLGSVLYTLCAGHPPFRAETTMAVLKRICQDTPRSLRDTNSAIPDWLEAAIARLHSKDPVARFATAQEVANLLSLGLSGVQTNAATSATLQTLVPRRPARRKPWAVIGAALAVLGVAVVAVAWWWIAGNDGRRADTTAQPPPQPWQPRAPLTQQELARLPDPLDEWRPADMPLGAWPRDQAPPELIGLLGDGPFRLPDPQVTHWPVQSIDGRLLAIPCGNDVILYDTETGALRRKLTGHMDRAFRGGFSSDGKRYACGSIDGAIRIWDVESGKEEASAQAAPDSPWTTHFAPGDQQVVVAGTKGGIKVWDGAAGSELRTFGEHQDGIPHFTFNPDRTRIASGGKDAVVKIWSWPDGALLKTLEGHREDVMIVAYSSNGALLATGSTSRVMIWDAATFQLLHTLPTAGDGLVAFTPDGQTLVTAPHFLPPGRPRAFARWDVKKGVALATFDVPGPRFFLVGDLSRDGRTVYLMTCDPVEPRLGAYDAVTGKERLPDQSGATLVWGVAFSPDGRWLASAGNDGRICLWDLARGPAGEFAVPARQLAGHKGKAVPGTTTCEVWSVTFSPDGELLASAGQDETIRLWKVADGQEVHVLAGHSFPAALLAFSPDGETLAAGNRDGGVNLWSVKTGQPKEPVRWHNGPVRAVAMSPDGRWLASGGFDRAVHLIDRASGQRVHALRGERPLTAVAFSPDSQTLAGICLAPRASLYLWDVATRNVQTFPGHTQDVLGIAFHPAGDRVATASKDGVRLWKTAPGADGCHVFDFRRVGSPIATAFAPSGRHLAVGLGNGAIAILTTPAADPR